MPLNSANYGCWIQFKLPDDKIIGANRSYTTGFYYLRRKVADIESNKDVGLRMYRGCQHMPIISIRKHNLIDQGFVSDDTCIGKTFFHQITSAQQLRPRQVGTFFEKASNPFLVNPVGPSRVASALERHPKEKVSQRCGV